MSGIIERYEDRVFEPVSTVHGRKLREEVLEEPETVLRTVDIGENQQKSVEETVSRDSLPLIAAIEEMLDWYEGYRDKFLRMARGSEIRNDYESFLIDMDNSLTPKYQSTQYARLKALKRQFMGGKYPCGRTCEAEYAEPVTVLFGLTASSLGSDGSFRPMADHDREIRDAWSGSSNSVKRTLRYVLEDTLGLSPGEYAWWWQSEPHPGPQKDATGYSHSHPVVIFDAAATSTPTSVAIDPETYRPIVAKHVSECEGAGWSAHNIEMAVTVREDDDIQDFAGYVSEYLAVAPDEDLLERSDEYLMWAASQWATTTQKYSRSRWATAACKADACQQQYFDPETEQTVPHGDSIVRSSKPGLTYECAECGSPHGIDQSESLAQSRLSESTTDQEQTDGGEQERTLAERWPSARSAGSLGSETRARRCDHDEPDTCPLCATETEAPNHTISGEVPIPQSAEAPPAERHRDGFEREPEWAPDAVVQLSTEEETEIGSPGGTAYGTIVVEGTGSIMDRTDLPYLPQPAVLSGPEPWENTSLFDEFDVRSGRVPPPELIAREWSETVQANGRVTPKQWSDDWYTTRFERQSSPPESMLCEQERVAIKELVESTGETSPISIAGQLMLPPSALDEIRSTVKSTI
ncbi:hypothetical protein [Halorubrum laminariae]|uniref:Uncharacterized protein n=1 Tax=Halorubrum laminariae TaxID=1433523 RepID=A0ABD6BXA4_9EURY|nr:hypothetical protein [Halorubrum laminariae]